MRTSSGIAGAFATLLSLCLGHCHAQTSYPMITHTTPVALERGKTTEITVEGQMSFEGVYKALFEGSGISAEIVPAAAPPKKPPVRSVKLRVRVAGGAELGIREFRLASSLGISSIGQLVIVDHPVILESEDNNTPAKANPIPVLCV